MFKLVNYVSAADGFIEVGLWRACGEDCGWSARWEQFRPVTFSTADNSKPVDVSTNQWCEEGLEPDVGGICVCKAGYGQSTMAHVLHQGEGEELQCKRCAAGTFNALPGNSTCKSCDPGFFQAASGSSSCEPCSTGSFQPLTGSQICLEVCCGARTSWLAD